jgi:glycosyltransferase involved in cell wall biosynthesis
MRISGTTIIRNGVKFGYPFMESIRSILPMCDEFVVCVGRSEDGTRDRIASIHDPKIRIIDTLWDPAKRAGGEVLSEQTNVALSKCSGDWIFYIQSDEVVSDKDFGRILGAIEQAEKDDAIDGIAFDYLHFYGSYSTVQRGRNWYTQEVRIVRNHRNIVSFGDAQGFRRNGKKIAAVQSGARIFHYGWARPPAVMMEKIRDFHRLWHDDAWIGENCASSDVANYFPDLGNLVRYAGDHPAVMRDRIRNDSPEFIEECQKRYLARRSIGKTLRDAVRRLPFGAHKNFILIKR